MRLNGKSRKGEGRVKLAKSSSDEKKITREQALEEEVRQNETALTRRRGGGSYACEGKGFGCNSKKGNKSVITQKDANHLGGTNFGEEKTA